MIGILPAASPEPRCAERFKRIKPPRMDKTQKIIYQ
jgi:hypothetical protein